MMNSLFSPEKTSTSDVLKIKIKASESASTAAKKGTLPVSAVARNKTTLPKTVVVPKNDTVVVPALGSVPTTRYTSRKMMSIAASPARERPSGFSAWTARRQPMSSTTPI